MTEGAVALAIPLRVPNALARFWVQSDEPVSFAP
jgi:hypothetical protein